MDAARLWSNWTKKRLTRRKEAIRRLFLTDKGELTPDAEVFFADLKRFCNARKSSIRLDKNQRVDELAMAVGEGRREVWDRITEYLYLDEKIITNLIDEKDSYDGPQDNN